MNFIDQLTAQQISAPLQIAPPGGFPVSERAAQSFFASAITYTGVLPPDAPQPRIMDWLRQHQTAVLATSGALFVFAIMKQKR